MKNHWFKKKGWLYFPIKWQGVLIALVFAGFCIHVFIFIGSKSNSASDIFYGVFPYVIPAFLLYHWIATHNGDKV